MQKLCKIRDIQRAVNNFESDFEKMYGICLNEGMALCSLANAERLSSGELGELLGLSHSNVSKVINSIEKKGLILRELGTKDKRRMFFTLSDSGRKLLAGIKYAEFELPEILLKSIEQ